MHEMSELWRDIFHDSDDYLRLVINDRLPLRWSKRAYDAGVLTSMVVGIPYEFGRVASGCVGCEGGPAGEGDDRPVRRGLYVCGVATRPEWRGRGEVRRLMAEQEADAREAGFDFLFLIPANDRLREYYRQYGYEDMAGMTRENIRPVYVSGRLSHSDDKGMWRMYGGKRYNICVIDDNNYIEYITQKYLQNSKENIAQIYTSKSAKKYPCSLESEITQKYTKISDKEYKQKYIQYSAGYCTKNLKQEYNGKYLHIRSKKSECDSTYDLLNILYEIGDEYLWRRIVKSVEAILEADSDLPVIEMSVDQKVMSDLLATLYDYLEPALRIWESQWGEWSVKHTRSQWFSIFKEAMLSGGILELVVAATGKSNMASCGVLSLKMRISGDGPHRGMMKSLAGESPEASEVGISLMLD